MESQTKSFMEWLLGGRCPYLALARDLASTVKRGCGQMVLYVVLELSCKKSILADWHV